MLVTMCTFAAKHILHEYFVKFPISSFSLHEGHMDILQIWQLPNTTYTQQCLSLVYLGHLRHLQTPIYEHSRDSQIKISMTTNPKATGVCVHFAIGFSSGPFLTEGPGIITSPECHSIFAFIYKIRLRCPVKTSVLQQTGHPKPLKENMLNKGHTGQHNETHTALSRVR